MHNALELRAPSNGKRRLEREEVFQKIFPSDTRSCIHSVNVLMQLFEDLRLIEFDPIKIKKYISLT